MRQKIVVVGGAGFIGSVLVSRLVGLGHEVVVFDKAACRSGVPSVVGNVQDRAALAAAFRGQDVVYNLAAEHRDDVAPLDLYEAVNVLGAECTCAAANVSGIKRIIFTSSVAVYGNSSAPLTEKSPHRPINEYGRTKSLAEEKYLAWATDDSSRSLVIVRPTAVFGPGSRGNIYNLIKQIQNQKFIMIGDGRNRKSIAYVNNVADFLAWLRDSPTGVTVLNYSDKPDFDMNQLVSVILATLRGNNQRVVRVPRPLGMMLASLVDVLAMMRGRQPTARSRVQKFTSATEISVAAAQSAGFQPQYSLEDGLRHTIATEFGLPPALGLGHPDTLEPRGA